MSGLAKGTNSVMDLVRQSPPLDVTKAVDDSWVKGKTIVITGGASGIGEGFFRRWAAAGANVTVGDINIEKGRALVKAVSKDTGNSNLQFVHCDVTSWQSQVELFKAAVAKSPHGGIDCVVANAGVFDNGSTFESRSDLDGPRPPEPNLKVLDVNLKGVMYTTQLALFWLQKNPGSIPANPKAVPNELPRDRHLLLVSSMAGLFPIPMQSQYTASKHAVVGLFRSVRGTTAKHGVRTNLLCPYYVDTPLLDAKAIASLGGGTLCTVDSVVNAATRFVADPRIVGRALGVGPKANVKRASEGYWEVNDDGIGDVADSFEIFAHDFEEVELSVRRIVKVLNAVEQARGLFGWISDILAALLWRSKPKMKAS